MPILKKSEVGVKDARPPIKPKPVVMKASGISRDFQQRKNGTLTRHSGLHREFSF
jgi:hypothetical protein